MRKSFRAGIVLSSFFCWAGMGTAAVAAERPAREPAPPAEEAVATKRFVVRVADGVDPAVLASRIGARLVASPEYAPGYHVYESATTAAASIAAAKAQARADVLDAEVLVARQQQTRDEPDDTLFPNQWHLDNTGQGNGTAGEDINVTPWWDFANNMRLGGGVNIAIVDDGLDIAHPDLKDNYKAGLSTDINGGDSNPSPGDPNNHGTAVAGLAAAFGDNALGVSGSAPRAGLAGIRLIAAPTTDQQEANALTFQNNNQGGNGTNDIYSNSWGPSDNGRTLAGPGLLTAAALQNTATQGRGGLGGVIVWAGGNGGRGDNVNYDGYANNRHVIAVGATAYDGERASYSEAGAALFVNAPSGDTGKLNLTTTDRTGTVGYNTASSPSGDYTNGFNGTSASTPIVAGVVALVLEANPRLTPRDVKHILARSSEMNDPSDPGWTINAGGRHHNHDYGFGRVDATAAATMAKDWVNVGAEISTGGSASPGLAIPDGTGTSGIGFGAPVASTILITDILNVETVEVTVNVTHTYRGDLEFTLTAPTGTSSVLGTPRNDPNDNYNDWTFTTVRNWDELSDGLWTLSLRDAFAGDTGTFNSWSLDIFGTAVPEPGGLAALILPGMALLMRRRRRA